MFSKSKDHRNAWKVGFRRDPFLKTLLRVIHKYDGVSYQGGDKNLQNVQKNEI